MALKLCKGENVYNFRTTNWDYAKVKWHEVLDLFKNTWSTRIDKALVPWLLPEHSQCTAASGPWNVWASSLCNVLPSTNQIKGDLLLYFFKFLSKCHLIGKVSLTPSYKIASSTPFLYSIFLISTVTWPIYSFIFIPLSALEGKLLEYRFYIFCSLL